MVLGLLLIQKLAVDNALIPLGFELQMTKFEGYKCVYRPVAWLTNRGGSFQTNLDLDTHSSISIRYIYIY